MPVVEHDVAVTASHPSLSAQGDAEVVDERRLVSLPEQQPVGTGVRNLESVRRTTTEVYAAAAFNAPSGLVACAEED